jgi:ATP-dependent Zn protease
MDTTSIMDLPTDPAGGGNVSNNVSMSAVEKQQENNNGNISLDQTTISQIVNSLQQASITGATQLPSRDIPMNTSGHTHDPYVQPNYVPQAKSNDDYIKNFESNDDIINNYSRNAQQNHVLDDMYNEIQTPLLLAVMYFLFQLPFFRTKLYIYLPILFSEDASMNVNGYIFNSVLFGLIYYMLNKITNQFAKF